MVNLLVEGDVQFLGGLVLCSAKDIRRRRQGNRKNSRKFTTSHDSFQLFYDTSRKFPTNLRQVCLFAHVTELVTKRHKHIVRCQYTFRQCLRQCDIKGNEKRQLNWTNGAKLAVFLQISLIFQNTAGTTEARRNPFCPI